MGLNNDLMVMENVKHLSQGNGWSAHFCYSGGLETDTDERIEMDW